MDQLESCKTDKPLKSDALTTPVDAQKDFVPQYGILYRAIRKGKLAEKVLTGKKLNRSDKQEMYFFLTSQIPPLTKRGRPSTKERDFNLAAGYLDELAKDRGLDALKDFRTAFAKKFAWSPSSKNSFHEAFQRGCKRIPFFVEGVKKRVEEGSISDPKRAISIADDLLMKLGNYEKKSRKRTPKTVKKKK
jgi:hypothetical protein